jgi:hypothetical protein
MVGKASLGSCLGKGFVGVVSCVRFSTKHGGHDGRRVLGLEADHAQLEGCMPGRTRPAERPEEPAEE